MMNTSNKTESPAGQLSAPARVSAVNLPAILREKDNVKRI
ncbi:TPA: putative lipopolysaccharide heptosyltransferase III, partial [Yersinia enterocolitica]|nr:putative lipopolysaccharide heptosyltransferase III [Yersinia enterocolitica]